MRAPIAFRRWYLFAALGLLVGASVGAVSAPLASSALHHGPGRPLEPLLDATHLPPLLTLRGEPVELEYDVECATGSEDVGDECAATGKVLARPIGSDDFAEIPLMPSSDHELHKLVARIPEELATRGFEYYAMIDAPETGESLTVPAGGASAPDVSRRMDGAVEAPFDGAGFGRDRRPGVLVASALWGEGSNDVGLESGRVDPIGASSFDVDAAGTVLVLDEAHRRMLRWRKGAKLPSTVPVSIAGTIADVAAGNDGSTYVLETTTRTGSNPLVRRFDEGGRELEAVESGERSASQIRTSPLGAVVLSHPSHQWLPVMPDGVPAAPRAQLARGRSGRPVRGGREIVVLRRDDEVRVALVAGARISRSWRLASKTALAEVQLAEPTGSGVVVVARRYDDRDDEFVVAILDARGLVDSFTIASADWAEAAPLGRFRLVGRSLYHLGSTPRGIFVDRFDLEAH
jgi:hypothetical protein